jgi:hypothetical protein
VVEEGWLRRTDYWVVEEGWLRRTDYWVVEDGWLRRTEYCYAIDIEERVLGCRPATSRSPLARSTRWRSTPYRGCGMVPCERGLSARVGTKGVGS